MYRAPPAPAPLVVCATGHVVTAISRRDGAAVWNFVTDESNARQNAMRCVVENDRVVVSACDASNGFLASEVPGVVTCLDYLTGHIVWQQRFPADRTDRDYFATTLLVDAGQVLVATWSTVRAYGLLDGHPLWDRRLPGATNWGASTALAIPGRAEQADRR